MQPLRVEFQLSGHMESPTMPIHLDSLIAYAYFQKTLEEHGQGEISQIIQQLPLEKFERDGLWVWKASALSFEGVSDAGMRHWTRKTVIPDYYATSVADGSIERGQKQTGNIDIAREKNLSAMRDKNGNPKLFSQKIDTVRGDMKSELQSYPVFTASKAVAYCIGDREELEMLLNPEMGLLTNIGKRTRLGQGKVVSLQITEDKQATDLWKRRILPWHEDGYLGIEANVIPPYWDISGRRAAWAHPGVF